jgi:hypothetical protein
LRRNEGTIPTVSRAGLRRRLSPTARHLAWLTVYYVLMATAIGVVENALPSIARPVASSVQKSGGSLKELVSSETAPLSQAESRSRAILRPVSAMLGAMMLALPVAWVYLITRRKKGFAQSIVHTLIVLPIAVAGIMVLVQNSLALAFSLAGIAALRFRNTLDDTKDAIYLFVATGIGIAAAVGQLDVGLALSLVYCVSVLVLWWTDVGRTPSRLKARLTMERLRHTAEMRVPGAAVPRRPDPLAAVLRIHSMDVSSTQRDVESVLADAAKQWELTGVTPGANGYSMLDYVVRLRARTERPELLNDLRSRGAPYVVGAEFR